MHILYTDKLENFKCTIDVEGSSIDETQARLILKSDKSNLLFEGKIKNSGECIIPINKLKGILKEGDTGNLVLEVISEDTLFSPYESTFTVKTSKKVTVEVQNNFDSNTKKKLNERVKVKVENPFNNHTENIVNILLENGINLSNMQKRKKDLNFIIENYCSKININSLPTQNILIENIINKLIGNP